MDGYAGGWPTSFFPVPVLCPGLGIRWALFKVLKPARKEAWSGGGGAGWVGTNGGTAPTGHGKAPPLQAHSAEIQAGYGLVHGC